MCVCVGERERERERVCVCGRDGLGESGTKDEVDAHGHRVGQVFWDPIRPCQVVPPPFRGLFGCKVLSTSYTVPIVYGIYRACTHIEGGKGWRERQNILHTIYVSYTVCAWQRVGRDPVSPCRDSPVACSGARFGVYSKYYIQ